MTKIDLTELQHVTGGAARSAGGCIDPQPPLSPPGRPGPQLPGLPQPQDPFSPRPQLPGQPNPAQ